MQKILYVYYPYSKEYATSRIQIARHVYEAPNRKFDMLSFKEISSEILENYSLVCLDFEVYLFGHHFDCISNVANMPQIDLFRELGCPLVVVVHDIHEYSFYNKIMRDIDENVPYYPSKKPGKGVAKFHRFLVLANVQHLIFPNYCQERDNILLYNRVKLPKQIKTNRVISLGFSPEIFHDYGETKQWDILISGARMPYAYTFRDRITRLLLSSQAEPYGFKIRVIAGEVNARIPYGEELAKTYNACWLCLSTTSNFGYLVRKYFEISACNSVVLGDINKQGRAIWGDNLVELNREMTDKEILETIDSALKDKAGLTNISQKMFKEMHNNYTYNCYVNQLECYFEKIIDDKNY